MNPDIILSASFDYRLVALSVFISILAAYAARDLAERLSDARGRIWLAWLVGGAMAHGIGIWSMHYTGMMAFSLPIPIKYDWPTVLLSLLVGMVGSGAALYVGGGRNIGWPRVLAAGVLLGGLGISGLHYTAMSAMRLNAMHHYSAALAILSVVLAIALSLASLTFLFRRGEPTFRLRNHGGAALLGMANPVMHYTAMAAVTYTYSGGSPDLSHAVSISSLDILGNSAVPVMVLVVALLTSLADRLRQRTILLRATTEQLRGLSTKLRSARENEAARIARELHDELGSALTALRWDLEEIDKMASLTSDKVDIPAIRKKIGSTTTLIDDTVNTVRRISSELRPSILDDLGLVAAIEWQAREFQTRTGIVCHCDCSMDNVFLDREQSTAVFRILQEALTNVIRHARATKVDIKIKQEDGQFVLTVSDNGRGITETEKSDVLSLGLLGMKERARLVGGEIDIARRQVGGTVITVRIPVARNGGH